MKIIALEIVLAVVLVVTMEIVRVRNNRKIIKQLDDTQSKVASKFTLLNQCVAESPDKCKELLSEEEGNEHNEH